MARKTKSTKTEKTDSEQESIDPFAYFFAGYDSSLSKAMLGRTEPTEWQGVRTKGYICDIDPDVNEAWIKKNYGGGRYELKKIEIQTGKIQARRMVDITGNPLAEPSLPLGPAGGAPVAFDPVEIDVGGAKIPYNGNLGELMKFVVAMKSLDQAFPVKPDINDALLTIALGQKNDRGDVLDQIGKIKAVMELFPSKESTGAGVADIINTAIGQAGQIIQGMTSVPGAMAGPVMRRKGGPGTGKTRVPALTTSETADKEKTDSAGDPANDNPQNQEVAMQEQQVLFVIAQQLVKNFRLTPPIPADRTVRMVDQILRQESKETRNQLKENYGDLVKDFALAELNEDWNDPDCPIGSREDFDKWCDQVWALYADPERVVVLA